MRLATPGLLSVLSARTPSECPLQGILSAWAPFDEPLWLHPKEPASFPHQQLSGADMRALLAAFLLTIAGPSLAAAIVVTDGDTFQLDGTIYRLDGIDAPEI